MMKSSQFQIQEKPHQRLSGVGKFPLLQEKAKKLFILQIAKLLSSFFSFKNSNYPVRKLLLSILIYASKCVPCLQQSAQNAERNLGVEYDLRPRPCLTPNYAKNSNLIFHCPFYASSDRIASKTVP